MLSAWMASFLEPGGSLRVRFLLQTIGGSCRSGRLRPRRRGRQGRRRWTSTSRHRALSGNLTLRNQLCKKNKQSEILIDVYNAGEEKKLCLFMCK